MPEVVIQSTTLPSSSVWVVLLNTYSCQQWWEQEITRSLPSGMKNAVFICRSSRYAEKWKILTMLLAAASFMILLTQTPSNCEMHPAPYSLTAYGAVITAAKMFSWIKVLNYSQPFGWQMWRKMLWDSEELVFFIEVNISNIESLLPSLLLYKNWTLSQATSYRFQFK